MKRKKILILLSILVITSVACSFGFMESFLNRMADNDEIGNQNATSVVEENNENQREEVGPESEQNSSSGLVDLTQGLSEIESYRFLLTQSIVGVDEMGNQVDLTVTNLQEVIKSLDMMHMQLESEMIDQPVQVLEVYRYGNEVFIIDTEASTGIQECSAFTENFAAFEEEDDLGLALYFRNLELGALLEKEVSVNGVLADHYRLNKVEMLDSELSAVQGDIWIAQDEGSIVQFNGSAEGEIFSQTEEILVTGTINWEFALTDVNQIVDIPLPEDCRLAAEGGVNDIPTPDNAQNLSIIGSMISFTVPDETSVLADFYRSEMEKASYLLIEEIAYEGSYAFTYQKAEETITILITQADNNDSDATIIVEVE